MKRRIREKKGSDDAIAAETYRLAACTLVEHLETRPTEYESVRDVRCSS